MTTPKESAAVLDELGAQAMADLAKLVAGFSDAELAIADALVKAATEGKIGGPWLQNRVSTGSGEFGSWWVLRRKREAERGIEIGPCPSGDAEPGGANGQGDDGCTEGQDGTPTRRAERVNLAPSTRETRTGNRAGDSGASAHEGGKDER